MKLEQPINNSNQSSLSESHYLDVFGSKMHYRELGVGRPIVFLHGMPVSSYVWRNVIQSCGHLGRCIAPDLIGMGDSDQPAIEYTVFDHIKYIEQFINQLALDDIVLVLHGWGSLPGFEYARKFSDRISGLVFFESYIRSIEETALLSLPVQELAQMLKNHDASYKAVIEQNYMIRELLPSCMVNHLNDKILNQYASPFKTEKSRQVFWQYLQDLPLGEGPNEVTDLIDGYSNWLQSSNVPKLMLYAMPGFNTTINTVQWARDNLSHLSQHCLEDVMHLPQESVPGLFSQALVEWYESQWQSVK